MARREWARKLIDKQPMARGGDSVDGNAAIKLLKAEHARAVRIVNAEIKHVSRMTTIYNDVECLLVQAALKRVIDQLTKGRA